MHEHRLIFRGGHLFGEIEGGEWLLDTGAPGSFGETGTVAVGGREFSVGGDYLGLTVRELSGFVGSECRGLLGGDVLGRFDHIWDCGRGTWTISSGELESEGKKIPLSEFMGIPILTVRIGGREHRMFFDTGAQVSYLQDESIYDFPDAGTLEDFYPEYGTFETETRMVEMELGGIPFTLRCGQLPGLLGATLMMAETEGIVGNQILDGRRVGYFPRRNLLCL